MKSEPLYLKIALSILIIALLFAFIAPVFAVYFEVIVTDTFKGPAPYEYRYEVHNLAASEAKVYYFYLGKDPRAIVSDHSEPTSWYFVDHGDYVEWGTVYSAAAIEPGTSKRFYLWSYEEYSTYPWTASSGIWADTGNAKAPKIGGQNASVGGIWVPVDKFGLLAPYIGLASTILVATVATAIYVKRAKREKQT